MRCRKITSYFLFSEEMLRGAHLMKLIAVFCLFVCATLSQAYAQLPYPEMKLHSSGGELHGAARSLAKSGINYSGYSATEPDDEDRLQLAMTDPYVNNWMYNLDLFARKTHPIITPYAAEAETRGHAAVTASIIGTSFTEDPYIQCSTSLETFAKVNTVINNVINKAESNIYTGGEYWMVCVPNNWNNAQEVPATFDISGFTVAANTPAGVSTFDEHQMYLKISWGNSYIEATYDQTYEVWNVSTYLRTQNPNGSYSYNSDSFTTDDYFLDGTFDTVENVAANGSVSGKVKFSTVPQTVSVFMPPVNNTHYVKNTVQNFLGSGSSSGQYGVYHLGTIKLTPGIKLKKP